jgi:hypothetical protein
MVSSAYYNYNTVQNSIQKGNLIFTQKKILSRIKKKYNMLNVEPQVDEVTPLSKARRITLRNQSISAPQSK